MLSGNLQRVIQMFESGKKIIPIIKDSNLIFYLVVDDSENFVAVWDLFLNGLRDEDLSFEFKIIEEKSKFMITIKEFDYILFTKPYNIISPSSFSLQTSGNVVFNKIAMSLTVTEQNPIGIGAELDLFFSAPITEVI